MGTFTSGPLPLNRAVMKASTPALSRSAEPVLIATDTYLTRPVLVSTWQTNKPEPTGLRPSGRLGQGIDGLKIKAARFCSALTAGLSEKAKSDTMTVRQRIARCVIIWSSLSRLCCNRHSDGGLRRINRRDFQHRRKVAFVISPSVSALCFQLAFQVENFDSALPNNLLLPTLHHDHGFKVARRTTGSLFDCELNLGNRFFAHASIISTKSRTVHADFVTPAAIAGVERMELLNFTKL
ncbi:MAG: hypothetical protein QOD12_454 [Verrucomicrobiota bacterium]